MLRSVCRRTIRAAGFGASAERAQRENAQPIGWVLKGRGRPQPAGVLARGNTAGAALGAIAVLGLCGVVSAQPALLHRAQGVVVPVQAEYVTRAEAVVVDLDLIAKAADGDTFVLDLPDGKRLKAVVRKVERRGRLRAVLHGELLDSPPGWFTFAVNGGAAAGSVTTGDGRMFDIRPSGEGVQVVRELDPSRLPECSGALAGRAGAPVGRSGAGAPGAGAVNGGVFACDNGRMIDILVVYTQAVVDRLVNREGVHVLIDLAEFQANEALNNSEVLTRWRVVGKRWVSYTESGSLSTDLRRLTDPLDGVLDEVHAMRQSFGADLVCMLVDDPDEAGVAWLFDGDDAKGFSVVDVDAATSQFSFAHEVGHNLGCGHAHGDGNGFFSYSHGHAFLGDSDFWQTVMSRSQFAIRVLHFSNPDVIFDGEPTGVPVGDPLEAHNALTINQIRDDVGAFRVAVVWNEQQEVLPDAGLAAGDEYGTAVGLSGDWLAVGAPKAGAAGEVHVFEFRPEAWEWAWRQTLLPDDGVGDAWFGWSVSVDGSRMVVGAPFEDGDGGASNVGGAYVFRYSGLDWIKEQRIAGIGEAGALFGSAVAISGDVVVVGAPQADAFGQDSGVAYVFRRDGVQWHLEETLFPVGQLEAGDLYGLAVAIDGDRIVVGAPGDDVDNTADAGSAYVFHFANGLWNLEDRVLAGDGGAVREAAQFGKAVAIAGDRIVVGAPQDGTVGEFAGAVFAYQDTGNGWSQIWRRDGDALDALGWAVSISGQRVVVGSPSRADNGTGAGAATVFDVDGGFIMRVLRSEGELSSLETAQFGNSVAISGRRIAVGAPLDDHHGEDAGAAYAFDAEAFDCECPGGVPGDLDADGDVDIVDFSTFAGCFQGSGVDVPENCRCADLDGDGDVDVVDFSTFAGTFGFPQR